jgi:lipopolysaccharide transport system ATP-binding protein
MGLPAIRVQDVSKSYRLGEFNSNRTIREAIYDSLARTAGRFRARLEGAPRTRTAAETFWALKDVSFEVERGDVLGIMGRNGAGKSTILKILSRITEPTLGRVEGYGRVGSLLEVGTGFHPELTGRENIYLNGAILGMSRAEIDRKFDEIVDFAEIEMFLDTPVKRYSSGMYVRLAFAVAAHLEPEILLVDEVLAVGDAQFQKKCLGKMSTVAKEGRTVLFISHNMAALRALCTRGILLEQGRVTCNGSVEECALRYASQYLTGRGTTWERGPDLPTGPLTIDRANVHVDGRQPDLTLELEIGLSSRTRHKPAFIAVDLHSAHGIPVLQALPRLDGFITDAAARHVLDVSIDLPGLVPGEYVVTIWVGSHNEATLDKVDEVVSFTVIGSPTEGRSFPHTPDHGYIVPRSSVAYRPG